MRTASYATRFVQDSLAILRPPSSFSFTVSDAIVSTLGVHFHDDFHSRTASENLPRTVDVHKIVTWSSRTQEHQESERSPKYSTIQKQCPI